MEEEEEERGDLLEEDLLGMFSLLVWVESWGVHLTSW